MRRNGFTLIELMIVVAVIVILAIIAIPNFMRFNEQANSGCSKISIFQDGKVVKEVYRRGSIYNNHGCVTTKGETFCGTLSVEKLKSCPQMAEQP